MTHFIKNVLLILLTVAGFFSVASAQTDASQAASATTLGNVVYLPQNTDGHYYSVITVDGKSLRMLVDTGASQITLSRKNAEKFGFSVQNASFSQSVSGLSGDVRAALWVIPSVKIGSIELTNVSAVVIDSDNAPSLLGMSVLNRLSQVSLQNGQMILQR